MSDAQPFVPDYGHSEVIPPGKSPKSEKWPPTGKATRYLDKYRINDSGRLAAARRVFQGCALRPTPNSPIPFRSWSFRKRATRGRRGIPSAPKGWQPDGHCDSVQQSK